LDGRQQATHSGVKTTLYFQTVQGFKGAGVALSVWCPTTNWTTGVRSPAEEKDFSSNIFVQTNSEAHPASYPMCIGGPFPKGKAQSGLDANHSPHLEPMSRMSRSYNSSPPCACLAYRDSFYLLTRFRIYSMNKLDKETEVGINFHVRIIP
jgi:hypothetical protein